MTTDLHSAFITGVERLSAWADLLDAINVFPVADGDTGRNLRISLAPIRELKENREEVVKRLLISARGNSGNIAARFFSGLLQADSIVGIGEAARTGRDRAWQAVKNPRHGTMLTIFDALVENLDAMEPRHIVDDENPILDRLEKAVLSTKDILPILKEAGVVDSGALGMFIFFDGFFKALAGSDRYRPIMQTFSGHLQPGNKSSLETEEGFCIDTVLHLKDGLEPLALSDLGDSIMVIHDRDLCKIHLHTSDMAAAKEKIGAMGAIIQWSDDDLARQTRDFTRPSTDPALHLMTDAAGSVTRDDARRLGMTLLDSYILVGERSIPETCVNPDELYGLMRKGIKVSTSQASDFERHQNYQRVIEQHGKTLYLAVGSAFTGNFSIATQWKEGHDRDGNLTVIDTGAASGRLGIAALSAAEFALRAEKAESVIDYSRRIMDLAEEYIFIDNLRFLAAGGRVSRASAFFGNMLNMKPVVTPRPEGVEKIGMTRNAEEQVQFALEKIALKCGSGTSCIIMVQYTDNRAFAEEIVTAEIKKISPGVKIILQPLSLTTGVHTGPGTWALAILPAVN